MRVAVFGLGEAGSLIAADLAGAGADVRGFDPAVVPAPPGVVLHDDPVTAVDAVELVIAVTAAADAPSAMNQAWDHIESSCVYADLATASPQLKRDLSVMAAERAVPFVDVALMSPVPGRGLSTPALASGTGADAYASAINPLGGRVEVLEGGAGAAAARKLTRSVVTKGLAGLVREAMAAARAAGDDEWAWSHIVSLFESTDEGFIERLIDGTEAHAERRLAEMETVLDYLSGLGVPSEMTAGTIEHLRRAT